MNNIHWSSKYHAFIFKKAKWKGVSLAFLVLLHFCVCQVGLNKDKWPMELRPIGKRPHTCHSLNFFAKSSKLQCPISCRHHSSYEMGYLVVPNKQNMPTCKISKMFQCADQHPFRWTNRKCTLLMANRMYVLPWPTDKGRANVSTKYFKLYVKKTYTCF